MKILFAICFVLLSFRQVTSNEPTWDTSSLLEADEDVVNSYNDSDVYSKEDCLFVSLGSNCNSSLHLREMGLRKEAYPLDWVLSTHDESLINLINDDFRYFTHKHYFSTLDPNEFSSLMILHNISVKNYYYDIFFLHDWPFEDSVRNPVDLENNCNISNKNTIGELKDLEI